METIEFKNVSFTYPGCDEKALDGIDLQIHPSEFLLLCGRSGCGKSTLLRQLKQNLAPYGSLEGEVLYKGTEIQKLDQRTASAKIGFVQQNPDNQIVTDKVWRELAFGLESLGQPNGVIRRRVAEMASFFNIQTWFRKSVDQLSGGQKQLLNLAAVMAMNPQVLILDEPTAQLDPIAASEFIAALYKINRELGVTVLISEHRLEELFPAADRVAVMDRGRVAICDTPAAVGGYLKKEESSGMFYGLPAVMKIYSSLGARGTCPLTVRESRLWLERLLGPVQEKEPEEEPDFRGNGRKQHWGTKRRKNAEPSLEEPAIRMEDVWFRYDKRGDDILRGVSLTVRKGELFCLLGGNGVGKSTALKTLCGIEKPYRGKITSAGKLCMVPQNPQALFTEITVKEELEEAFCYEKLPDAEKERRASEMLERLGMRGMEEMHPYDLSGGEQQRLAIGKILLLEPEVLLLDEPTKGLDPFFKRVLAELFSQLTHRGVTILMVSHDVEFCAEYADRCGLFFDGDLISSGPVTEFFCGNRFYTTAANRIAGAWFPEAITWEEVVELCAEATA